MATDTERNLDYPSYARCVLLDIEGTICSISFVKDTLFPYALKALPDVLKSQWDSEEFSRFRDEFPEEHRQSPEALQAHVEDLTERNVKVAYLKNLQGYLWEHGFRNGEYSTTLYPDVVHHLKLWRKQGRKIAIYSSGSVFAQKLLFEHVRSGPSVESGPIVEAAANVESPTTAGVKRSRNEASNGSAEDELPPVKKPATSQEADEPVANDVSDLRQSEPDDSAPLSEDTGADPPSGDNTEDLRYLIFDWFDTTNAGPKTEESSYSNIAKSLDIRPCDMFFLSDNVDELKAACNAGMDAQLVRRPGNAPVSKEDKFWIGAVKTFDHIGLQRVPRRLQYLPPGSPVSGTDAATDEDDSDRSDS